MDEDSARSHDHSTRNQRLLLLNFILLMASQPFDFSRSLCRASVLSKESSAPPSLVLSKLNLHAFKDCIQAIYEDLKRTSPKMEPYKTLVVTGHQSDVTIYCSPLCLTCETVPRPSYDVFI